MKLTRRTFLEAGGALTIAFSLSLPRSGEAAGKFEDVTAWLRVDESGKVTVFCGKAELGTGISTALAQLVAEELDVDFEQVRMVLADTAQCPDQLPTFGSLSVFRAGPELRRAAAEARIALLELAATKTGTAVDRLATSRGAVVTHAGDRLAFGQLVQNGTLHRTIRKDVPLKHPKDFKVVGQSKTRVDIPGKVFGTYSYIQDHTVEGMLHGRVCRAPLPGAKPAKIDDRALKGIAGNPRVIAKGNFVAVVANTEIAAIRAATALKVQWTGGRLHGTDEEIKKQLQATPARKIDVVDTRAQGKAPAEDAKTIEAEYLVPFQMHASIGPSCAVAHVEPDKATVWSPTQSSFLTRDSLATMLGLPSEKVRLVWMEGSGCYGHNGADDCTADAALLSQQTGKPVRVQWMRHDEHRHEPKGAAMLMRARAGVTAAGQIVDWDFETWSPSHSSRPFAAAAGNLLAGDELGLRAQYSVVGADYNLKPSYVLPREKVTLHLVESAQLRVSALRALGSFQNVFAIESFMDELAHASGQDPIEFRTRHLKDERSRNVLQTVARMSGWKGGSRRSDAKTSWGQGVGFVYYNNYGARVAAVVDVAIDNKSGEVTVERMSIAHDCGLVVNPDGLKNQIEGSAVQALSRALLERVAFKPDGVTSLDWAGYPLLRFSKVPKEIAIELVNLPDQPSLGAGEQTTCAVLPAVANAIYTATGARVREVPFTPERILKAKGRA
jgi:nicotinate dehydrogenase subunit B